jgi:hypothetical protein
VTFEDNSTTYNSSSAVCDGLWPEVGNYALRGFNPLSIGGKLLSRNRLEIPETIKKCLLKLP